MTPFSSRTPNIINLLPSLVSCAIFRVPFSDVPPRRTIPDQVYQFRINHTRRLLPVSMDRTEQNGTEYNTTTTHVVPLASLHTSSNTDARALTVSNNALMSFASERGSCSFISKKYGRDSQQCNEHRLSCGGVRDPYPWKTHMF